MCISIRVYLHGSICLCKCQMYFFKEVTYVYSHLTKDLYTCTTIEMFATILP